MINGMLGMLGALWTVYFMDEPPPFGGLIFVTCFTLGAMGACIAAGTEQR